MKMLMGVTDSDAFPAMEEAMIRHGLPFTVVPGVFGEGRDGLRAGNRVHPGSSNLFFSVVADDRIEETLGMLVTARDAAHAATRTRFFILPVERAI